jgi:hypothetical protein
MVTAMDDAGVDGAILVPPSVRAAMLPNLLDDGAPAN